MTGPGHMFGDDFRVRVVDRAVRLFETNGYDATTVDQIAAAAGISRRTFFRQFHSKEDVVFADHRTLLAQAEEYLAADAAADPWRAVCGAAELVFARFAENYDIHVRRYRVVHAVPALREQEIVTVYRYERLFADHLRRALPDAAPLAVVQFTAAVTSSHNHLLREMLRGNPEATIERLRAALDRLCVLFARDRGDTADAAPVVVVVASSDATSAEIADRVRQEIDRGRGSR